MRVAVVEPARTEPDGTEVPESTFAYKSGRIEDFVNPLTGETTPAEQVAETFLKQAQEEYPDREVRLERLELHPANEGESQWVSQEDFNPSNKTPGGSSHSMDHTVEQPQEAQ